MQCWNTARRCRCFVCLIPFNQKEKESWYYIIIVNSKTRKRLKCYWKKVLESEKITIPNSGGEEVFLFAKFLSKLKKRGTLRNPNDSEMIHSATVFFFFLGWRSGTGVPVWRLSLQICVCNVPAGRVVTHPSTIIVVKELLQPLQG